MYGINVGYLSSCYSLSCMVIGVEGDDMQCDYVYMVNCKVNLLNIV